ncbi:MAG: head maturation protease, ClpP-related [Micromonosporaceae bacterium]
MTKTWYRIENKADTATVYLYDEIGMFGVSAGSFAKELGEVNSPTIDLRLNSPGGEVFDGLAIYNALQRHPARITVHVDGIAASVTSVIAMAGDEILIDRYAQMMIHEAHAIAVGSTKDMSAMARLLDEYSDNIAAIYATRAGGDKSTWRDRMKAETWFSAAEAVKAGLADRVAEGTVKARPAATWDLSIFNHAGREHAPDPFATGGPIEPTTTGPDSPEMLIVPVLTSMACPMHESGTAEGTWDASMHEGRMPSPMSVAMAKKFYAWYDPSKVEDAMMPKSAGKLPHHEVGEDGTPGAANLSGVRNALSRLPQSDIPEADVAAVRAHLQAHLGAAEDHAETPPVLSFDPEVFRASMSAALRVDYDPGQIRDLMTSLSGTAPAPPAPTAAPVDLGPLPVAPAPEPEPAPDPWAVIRAAVRMAADDAPAPPQPSTEDPAQEPGLFVDAQAFRTALRRATL